MLLELFIECVLVGAEPYDALPMVRQSLLVVIEYPLLCHFVRDTGAELVQKHTPQAAL
jgi:hypothetical protein